MAGEDTEDAKPLRSAAASAKNRRRSIPGAFTYRLWALLLYPWVRGPTWAMWGLNDRSKATRPLAGANVTGAGLGDERSVWAAQQGRFGHQGFPELTAPQSGKPN